MDPTQCLKEILELLAEYQESREYMPNSTPTMKWYREETIEHLENLLRWLKKGGFMPCLPAEYLPHNE